MKIDVLDLYNPDIRVVNDFLSHDFCEQLIRKIQKNNHLWDSNPVKVWDKMSMKIENILSKQEIESILKYSKELINERFKVNVENVSIAIVRWIENREQIPHIDFFENDSEIDKAYLIKYGIDDKYLNGLKNQHAPYHFSSMLYLNENFDGGELYFPQYENFEIKPAPGMIVMFSGNTKNLHGVKKITSGTRYVISMFWKDLSK